MSAGSHPVGRQRMKWIDTVKECLKERDIDVREPRRMVQDKSQWRGFVGGNTWGVLY